ALSARSKARRFMTGRTPGIPVQTGHVAELGGRPNCVLQPQNSLVQVRSWTWTSRPMTIEYLAAVLALMGWSCIRASLEPYSFLKQLLVKLARGLQRQRNDAV